MPKAKDSSLNPLTGEIEIPHNLRDSQNTQAPPKGHEIIGVLVGLGALFMLLSLVSYRGFENAEVGNLVGIGGEWTAHIVFTMLGYCAYLLDIVLWISAISLFRPSQDSIRAKSILGIFFIVVLSSITLHTALGAVPSLNGASGGGFIGGFLGEILLSLVSTVGTYIVTLGSMLIVILLITDISIALVARSTSQALAFVAGNVTTAGSRVFSAWRNFEIRNDNPEDPEKEDPDKKGSKKEGSKSEKAEDLKETQGKSSAKNKNKNTDPTEPKIVTNKKKSNKKAAKKDASTLNIDKSPVKGQFQLPSVELLALPPATGNQSEVDEKHLKDTADTLVKILSDFGVIGEVREIHPGPVVTMFEFQPQSGTKLSKIENLSSEIAMALEVLRVRVVAPIPGKNAVGFELPNKKRETVYLREMITDDGFAKKKSKLPLAIGKDISGSPYFVDLAKMPHLLIAGTTGSGKSVSLNTMLLSLLYKYTPDDLRLLMVDPKMIELGIYDGIPHLLLPVVTDMSKACLALKWAVDEMERRYQLFADLGVRNLDSYNKKIKKLKDEAKSNGPSKKPEEKIYSVEGNDVVVVSNKSEDPEKLDKLPFIGIVVDELADLMMVAAKDVETSIARLAQKARAAGIHLIIATQRPSVDVITGLIKANFPSRVSFRVSSGHDSRTILGTNGAENLLGMGDMLIMPPGTSDLTRVHGAFVDDDEIHEIVSFLKSQGTPEYDAEILKPREEEENAGVDEEEKDEVYDQAVAIVAEAQVCSISMLQRRLRIGYNRSARIVEIMEKEGVVGAANGVNKREVLISPR